MSNKKIFVLGSHAERELGVVGTEQFNGITSSPFEPGITQSD